MAILGDQEESWRNFIEDYWSSFDLWQAAQGRRFLVFVGKALQPKGKWGFLFQQRKKLHGEFRMP